FAGYSPGKWLLGLRVLDDATRRPIGFLKSIRRNLVLLIGVIFLVPMLGNGRSPHTIYLPEQIDVGFDDVKGLGTVVTEVSHTLDVFLNHKKFRSEMGGNPRRGVLFEGPPGTGKTHAAKAMAKEAGVPFLFVSSTSFQSMWYGATARKIRAYFRRLRKIARREGGAIGFIEEIDAIGVKRGGMSRMSAAGDETATLGVNRSSMSEGVGGVVNELLIQMQSFDEPTRLNKLRDSLARLANGFLRPEHQFNTTTPPFANILLSGATNRADSLDPALLRPGRFDRVLHFGLPGRRDRRELIDYFLETKAHSTEFDADDARDSLAGTTMGYTPAALERLFDEALLVALRAGRRELTRLDMRQAQMEVEIGLPHPVDYPPDERATIATHEAGHAVVAYLAGQGRRLEVLSIIKRRDSLGLLSHRDEEERFTKRASEMNALLQISFGGMVAEEMFFGESGTGPAGDLAAATALAVDMVGSYGLGDSLISFRSLDSGALGGNLVAKVLADGRARKTVDRILSDAKHETTRLLVDHRYLVEALRDALLDREELVEDEILSVLRTAETSALSEDRVLVDLRNPHGHLVERHAARIELMDD
ncbi:MAG: AAA family ATPase, partial [Acidimicrobiia bacterium]